MSTKYRNIHKRKSREYRYIIFFVIILVALQVWVLRGYYKELIVKIPEELFTGTKGFPVSEMTIDSEYSYSDLVDGLGIQAPTTEETLADIEETIEEIEEPVLLTDGQEENNNSQEISQAQKDIVLRLNELLEEDITYGYEVYPETGYPDNDVWISTDVISVVLNDVGYDLMELIYADMEAHKEDYPLDIKGRNEPLKYVDFRDVFFQEQFFKRNALELPLEFDPADPNLEIQWQPGDILYFQFDPENPYMDLGGFVSSRTNDQGVPLVIMISKEFGSVSEVDVLNEYTIVGHYRYPNPYEDEV